MEATGGREQRLARALDGANLPVAVVSPRQVRDCARAMGILAKTGAVDARVMAGPAAGRHHRPWTAPDPAAGEPGELASRRLQLVGRRVAGRSRRRPAGNCHVRAGISRAVAGPGRRMGRLDQGIAGLIAPASGLETRADLTASVPGAGPQLVAVPISHLPEPGSVGSRQACALAGVAPPDRDSGRFSGKRSVRGGRSGVRPALYMAALAAPRHNPRTKAFHDRPAEAGRPGKVAPAACMGKLPTILNSMPRHGEFWRGDRSLDAWDGAGSAPDPALATAAGGDDAGTAAGRDDPIPGRGLSPEG